jgi:hypothetical protein
MHRTSLKKKVRQYLFMFPKIRGDTQTDNHPRDTRQSVYKLMALRSQSPQQNVIEYNCKSVATVTVGNMGDWESGIGERVIEKSLIFQLPITHYPLPITNLGAKIIGLLTL